MSSAPDPSRALYPLSFALGVKPVGTGAASHAGFDERDVEAKLGATRFTNLMAKVKSVFSIGHDKYPGNYAVAYKRGCEVHCIYADDLEAFLKAGG